MDYTCIKKHMEVIGADGVHIGTVDRVEHGKIRLSRSDSGEGHHKGHYHFIDLGFVADVEGQKVRLSANAAIAVTLEEEQSKPGTCLDKVARLRFGIGERESQREGLTAAASRAAADSGPVADRRRWREGPTTIARRASMQPRRYQRACSMRALLSRSCNAPVVAVS
jgi:hypothetical protein